MSRKKMSMILQAGLAGLLLVACAPATVEDSAATSSETVSVSSSAEEMRTFTLEELSQYNGKNGQPAYVAVDGVVYDVTNVEAWKNGEHKMGLTAGNELTEEITNQSPHGKKVLEELPIVGELVE
ncbi:cytochrome b5 domain-containing protein [Trichococcus sp.]|uniref:cytochrome b5 domain-containing protein n=1 Tax=Trichococcus sp. TaxID=1985464 RepID=UPI003C79AFB7